MSLDLSKIRSGELVRGVFRTSGNVPESFQKLTEQDPYLDRISKGSLEMKNSGEIASEFGIGRQIDIFA